MLHFTLYIGYINKIQQHVPPYNISHISLISLIFSKALKTYDRIYNPTVVSEIIVQSD